MQDVKRLSWSTSIHQKSSPMSWYADYLWRVPAAVADEYRVCATDRVGSRVCGQ
jgi:hypothetical protein